MRHVTLPAFLLIFGASMAYAQDVPKTDYNKIYFEKLTSEAAQGNTRSEVCLGEMYATGPGVELKQDLNKSLSLYQSAADHGDLEGERHVGMAYMYGMGVQKNVDKAALIFRSLFEKGYAPSALDISLMYTNGMSVQKDEAQALTWLERGANGGDPAAQIRLAIQYHFGEHGLKKDDALAQEWLTKAVSQKIDCMTTYIGLIPFIADVYLGHLDIAKDKEKIGKLGIKFTYHDQRAMNPELVQSSGSKQLDDAWLDAVRAARLPPWPESFITDNYTIGFWLPDGN